MRLTDPAVSRAPHRPPTLSRPPGRLTSDGCGNVRGAPAPPFGENRNVRPEDELDRSTVLPGEELRVLGALGLKLREGVWLTEGLDGGLKLRAGAWPTEGLGGLKEGLEDVDGADRGALNDGLGRLDPTDGPGRPAPAEGPENDLCMLDIRSPPPGARLAICPARDVPAIPWREWPDLSLPIDLLPAMGEISTAAITVITAARDLIFSLANILLLLPSARIAANVASSELPRSREADRAEQANNRLY